MNLIVFPGQGSQRPGMSADLYNRFASVKQLYKIAEEISGLPLINLLTTGTESDYKPTTVSQVAIMVASMAVLKSLEEVKSKPVTEFAHVLAGHSLGEYTALVAAQVLSFEDAVKLLKARSECMAQAGRDGDGMLAVIGITDHNKLQALAKQCAEETGETCELANDNSTGQVILSGNKQALERAAALAKSDFGAKIAKFLEVSGAFHSSLMQTAADEFSSILKGQKFGDFALPVICNVTAEAYSNSNEVASYLYQQITKPVRWRESMLNAINKGVTLQAEVGPGKVLTGLMRRIDSAVNLLNFDTLDDLNRAEELI